MPVHFEENPVKPSKTQWNPVEPNGKLGKNPVTLVDIEENPVKPNRTQWNLMENSVKTQ